MDKRDWETIAFEIGIAILVCVALAWMFLSALWKD